MKINLSPVRSDNQIAITKEGDKLFINGEAFDFSVIPEGAILPASAISSPYFVGEVKRVSGSLEMTILLPHGANASHETRFPVPIVDPADGPINLPAYEIVPVEEPFEDLIKEAE